jgi:hypothetical protein
MVGESLRAPFAEQVVVQGLIGGLYAALVGVLLLGITRIGKRAQV